MTRQVIALASAFVPALAGAQYSVQVGADDHAAEAGSSLDFRMRIVTRKMAEGMGQEIQIDNQPGAAGLTGTGRFMQSAADGFAAVR